MDRYRRQASFNWHKLQEYVYGGRDIIEFKNAVCKTLESDPVFQHPIKELTRDEQQRTAMIQCMKLSEYRFLSDEEFDNSSHKRRALGEILTMLNRNTSAKRHLHETVTFSSL